MPSSKGSEVAASTALAQFCGAIWLRIFFALALAKAAKISGAGEIVRSRTFFSGRFSATTFFAKAMACSRSLPSSTISSTRPAAAAALALIGSPPVIISSAFSTPTIRGSRWVPPAPGSRPIFTSGRPTLAEGTATR